MPREIREIRVTVAAGESATDTDTDVEEASGSSGSSDKNITKAAFAKMLLQTASVVGNEVIAWADYDVDKTMNLEDDYIGQRNKAITEFYINGAVSAVSTVANTALTGFAVGGVWGAVIGAVIGVGTVAARTVRSNEQGNDKQNIQLKQMDLSLQYTRRRAGWSTHAASIGEDL